ncbi:exosome complex protein Rrp42 [[Eubacterium] cellulosolvens]
MSTTPHSYEILTLERDHIIDLASKGKRIDNRSPMDYREVKIQTGIIEKANGSAQVEIGKTKVIAGVKIEIGTPFPDTPNQGVQTVNAELTPIAHPTFELGPPGENSIELARIVDRNLRESKAIDLDKLSIVPGEKAFVVFIDLNILDHYGNLIDASTYAALSALLTCNLNEYEVKNDELIIKENKQQLPMNDYPVPITFAKIGKTLMLDPNIQEENAMSTRLTVGIDNEDCVCAMQKGGLEAFEPSEIESAVGTAIQKSKEIRKLIMEATR